MRRGGSVKQGRNFAAAELVTPDAWPVCPRCGELYPGEPWRRKCVCGCRLYPASLDEPRKRA